MTDDSASKAAKAANYEQWMAVEMYRLIHRGAVPEGPLLNAVLESLLHHTRVLAEFYLRKPEREPERYIIAADFLPGWDSTDLLTNVRKRLRDLDLHLANITETRVAHKVSWDESEIISDLCQAWGVFLDRLTAVDPVRRRLFDSPNPADALRRP